MNYSPFKYGSRSEFLIHDLEVQEKDGLLEVVLGKVQVLNSQLEVSKSPPSEQGSQKYLEEANQSSKKFNRTDDSTNPSSEKSSITNQKWLVRIS